jgi:hypothetical protein
MKILPKNITKNRFNVIIGERVASKRIKQATEPFVPGVLKINLRNNKVTYIFG